MKRRFYHGRWLILILLIYLSLGIAYSVTVPLAESPDELDHFHFVQYLLHNRALPVMQPHAAANDTMEANQPPLYYLLNTAVLLPAFSEIETAVFPQNSCYSFAWQDVGRQHFYRHDSAEQFPYKGVYLAFHLARFLSVLMGAGTIMLAYSMGWLISGGRQTTALLAASLLAFNPQFIFINASVNNDVLTALLGAAIIALSAYAAGQQEPRSNRFAALLGVLVGLGLLTKFALLALWPIALTAVIWPQIIRSARLWKPQPSKLGQSVLLVLLIPIMLAGWQYVRAHQLYGDPLAWTVHLQAKGSQVLRTSPLTLADLGEFVQLHFQSYWALFGWLNVQAPTWVYLLLAGLTLTALAGLLLEAGDWLKRMRRFMDWENGRFAQFSALLIVTLSVSAIYVSLFRYIQTINWSGYQGRLAYAVAAPIAALLALGLLRLARAIASRYQKQLRFFVAAGLGMLALGSLLFLLLPAYPRPQIYQPAQVQPACARFSDGFMLEGYDFVERVQGGEKTAVTLYGYGLTDSPRPQTVTAQLVSGDGAVIAQADQQLTWQAEELISVTMPLSIQTEAIPSRGILQVGLLTEDGAWQQATNATGWELGRLPTITTVKIAPRQPLLAAPQNRVDAPFGDQIALYGYDWHREDDTLIVRLYWQAMQSPTADYTRFIHLLDADGNLVWQDDRQPHDGLYPTSIWETGEFVEDVIVIPFSTETQHIAVGLYTAAPPVNLLLSTGEASYILEEINAEP